VSMSLTFDAWNSPSKTKVAFSTKTVNTEVTLYEKEVGFTSLVRGRWSSGCNTSCKRCLSPALTMWSERVMAPCWTSYDHRGNKKSQKHLVARTYTCTTVKFQPFQSHNLVSHFGKLFPQSHPFAAGTNIFALLTTTFMKMFATNGS
jgi:hypothetical protein